MRQVRMFIPALWSFLISLIKGTVIFLASFLLYHVVFSSYFPVDENNVLQAPEDYALIGIGFAFTVVIIYFSLSCNRKKKYQKKRNGIRLLGKTKTFLKRKLEESKKRKEFDSLSESEQWKLERESKNASESIPQYSSNALNQIAVDPIENAAARIIFETGQASVSIIQRKLHLGYARAAMMIDHLENLGVVGPFMGSTPREILITEDTYRKNVKIVESFERESENPYAGINVKQIIADETRWRIEQQGISEIDYELSRIDSMEGHDFEHWCAELLEENGFSNVEVTVGSGDQGVDVLAQKDGIRYAIQCKCYSKDLGNKPVQEVNTGKVLYRCQIGVVMTNRYFTKGAKDAADATGVLLWDRDKLKQMMES